MEDTEETTETAPEETETADTQTVEDTAPQAEESTVQDSGQIYAIPEYDITVKASSASEAIAIAQVQKRITF